MSMKHTDKLYAGYLSLLQKELVPAMGCTEPVALALVAAKARDILGNPPDRILVEVSGNIIKNVKSVVIPNTGGLKGIIPAVAAGYVAGDSDKALEIFDCIESDMWSKIESFVKNTPIVVQIADTERVLEIIITVYSGESWARVRLADAHTNIVSVIKDGQSVFQAELDPVEIGKTSGTMLDVQNIVNFADAVNIADVRDIIERQIEYNSAISKEGLSGEYGANIGKLLRESYGDDIKVRAKSAAAAGSDARMGGCGMPVIILSGSGNQGMTASLPVIEYAGHLGSSHEELIRALALSDLIAIHLKTGIGRLSAYCGVVCAGAAAGAGIAYLHGEKMEGVAHTLANALAITSGIVCDGAKPSCAAKIASSVDAGILGYEMFRNGRQFYGGDGILSKGVEKTIRNIWRLGKEGMYKTDKEILQIMLED